MRRLTLLASLLLCGAAPATAQDWRYGRSEHFELYTTGSERGGRDVLADLEQVHGFFADFLQLSTGAGQPTRVIIFSREEDYARYRPTAVSQAYAQFTPDGDYIVMRRGLDIDARPVVVHEYAHLMIGRSGRRYPLWLTEGLADYFSTMTPERGRMSVGAVPAWRLSVLESGRALMPLDQLFAAQPDSVYTSVEHAGLFYSQSWALTHMLLSHETYRPRAEAFLELVAAGAPTVAALRQTFGRTPAEVQEDLVRYIRRGVFPYVLSDYVVPPATAAAVIRALDSFEGELVAANLLAYAPTRQADARAAFEKLAAERPDHPGLGESRARFERWMSGRLAPDDVERMVAVRRSGVTVYRTSGRMTAAEFEQWAAKAVAVDPANIALRLLYADTLISGRKLAQAVATLAAVKEVPRDSAFRYFELLALVYRDLKAMPQARAAAQRAQEVASEGAEAAYAAQLLRSLDEPQPDSPSPAASVRPSAAPPNPAVADEPLMVSVRGRLRAVVCGRSGRVIEVEGTNGIVRLAIDDPAAVAVAGTGRSADELSCGAHATPIRVGYLPGGDAAQKTAGRLRLLDYRPSK